MGRFHHGASTGRPFQNETFPLYRDLQTLFAGEVATDQFAISSTGSTKRKLEEDIVVDDCGDESFCDLVGNNFIVKEEEITKDAPLMAAKQRERQPLLKKSSTEKVLDLLSSIVGGKSESELAEALRMFSELHLKKYSVKLCVQIKKYLSNSSGNTEAFLSASDEEVAFFIDDALGVE